MSLHEGLKERPSSLVMFDLVVEDLNIRVGSVRLRQVSIMSAHQGYK